METSWELSQLGSFPAFDANQDDVSPWDIVGMGFGVRESCADGPTSGERYVRGAPLFRRVSADGLRRLGDEADVLESDRYSNDIGFRGILRLDRAESL